MPEEYPDAAAEARELGALAFENSGNWHWAMDFPTELAANDFIEWLDAHGYEHRRAYRPWKGRLWSVRYRNSSANAMAPAL
jgi:hypothetical protein